MFKAIGHFVFKHPLICITSWLAAAVVLNALRPSGQQLLLGEPITFLPADAPSNLALDLFNDAFPDVAARSQAAILLARPSGLTDADHLYIKKMTDRLVAAAADEHWHVQSPALQPYLKSRLLSTDNAAAMVVVNLETNFITKHAVGSVLRLEAVFPADPPAGLQQEITGTAGIGRDYADQANSALRRTTIVTVVAVLFILALVYRAPLAAVIPLVSIGITVSISFRLLELLAVGGWGFSDAEKTFIVVLLFGAGTDYALFWIWRYREHLTDHLAFPQAATRTMQTVGPAILASAGTTIAGLLMLSAADLVTYKNSGRSLSLALALALLAAFTLIPALATLSRRFLFWPGKVKDEKKFAGSAWWNRIAAAIVAAPRPILIVVLLCFIPPVLVAMNMTFRYDTLAETPPDSSSARGMELAQRHFSPGQIFSLNVMIQSDRLNAPDTDPAKLAETIAAAAMVDGIVDVWSLAAPLGQSAANGQPSLAADLIQRLLQQGAGKFYLSDTRPVMRMELMLKDPPLSNDAMAAAESSLAAIRKTVADQLDPNAVVLASGPTPYIADIRSTANADQARVMPLVVIAIWIVVYALVRNVPLSAFLLLATLLTYAATIGLAHMFFVHILGEGGIDYKVNLFLFVFIVAVGQDYNIFLVTRLRQESADHGLNAGAVRAIVRTGPVISNCGLIMAATLGSLAATDLDLLKQLGFALGLGILIDTYLVRPLLVPTVYLLLERRKPAETSSP
jgi:RND superfamily putative drug exporter